MHPQGRLAARGQAKCRPCQPGADMNHNWFEIKKLPGNIYAIMEPYHFQEVISYLIIGSRAAVLMDTGAGIGDIAKTISNLYSGEIIVINSHIHFDHVGDNHRFSQVLVYNHPAAIARLKKGYTRAELAPHAKLSLFAPGKIGDFDPAKYNIPPSNPVPVEDGHIIDLGDRRLRVIHTPGHSPDSVMLLDEGAAALFTGDSYYPGYLYCHYEGDFYGPSNLADYARSMKKIAELAYSLKTIHPGHNSPSAESPQLKKAAQALDELLNGRPIPERHLKGDLTIASLPNSGEKIPGYVIPDDLYVYNINGIKIISRKR